MKHQEKQQGLNTPPPVGGSALLVIFGVLCLTVFALLSLNTALSQQRLANSALEGVQQYYAADLQAEEIFACLRAGEVPEGVEQKDGKYLYTCPISDRQTLYVELQEAEGTWTVLRWQAATQSAVMDDNLHVWGGGETID